MNTSVLLLGVLASSLGLGYFLYGKKQHAGIPLVCGIALMVVPYFFSSLAALLAISVVLAAIPWLVRR